MSKQKNLIEASQNVTFDTDGNVGIGTSSPSAPLDVVGSVGTLAEFRDGVASNFIIETAGAVTTIGNQAGSSTLAFKSANAERMRIDSSGNLLMGKTDSSIAVAGFAVQPSGQTKITQDGADVLRLNRLTSDGSIVDFRKDGSTVGKIMSTGGTSIAVVGSSGTGIRFISSGFFATNSSGDNADNQRDVGSLSVRWDDVYATNGNIQTSDRNEKQQIASLTTAEITAAKAISQLFKTFKWNDSVADKGDAARTHSGVIAQEVEQAMTDAGLDAGDYAFFISSTWWETQTDVPAVVADPENDVEAKDAYTRTDTYDTAEEAPAGATERTRKGIRYPELLAFVGAATEQRLADIETRLTALEAV